MKTLTMTPSPNKIIAALLDIAQAAYVLIHSPGKGMADNLKVQMERLETLPQYCNNPVNGPCRARKYLESFLVGEHIVGEIAMTRTRPFGDEGVDMLTVDIAKMRTGTTLSEADIETITRGAEQMRTQPLELVPGDAIGFEVSQEWKGPAKLHIEREFVPSAEFPTSGPINHDFYSHRQAWRDLIQEAENATESEDHASYIEHELRAFDRAFASLPPVAERREKPRLDLPTIPVVGKDALIDATRPLFEKAMKAEKHRADLDERGLYKGMTEHRFEGWRAAVQVMGFKPGSDDIGSLREQAEAWQAVSDALHQHVPEWSKLSTRAMDSAVLTIGDLAKKRGATILHHMLADKTDEAMRIINDAGLLKNFVELFTMRDPGVTMLKVYEAAHCDNSKPWNISVYVENKVMRNYRSTSLHQAIVKAHKGEQDHEYPEHEQCQFCGFTVESPCEAPPPAECPVAVAAQIASIPKPAAPTVANSPRKPYTTEIGEAGQTYMDSFKFGHPLPVTFRWSKLWDVLNDAAGESEPALLTQVGWRHIMHQEHGQERVALTESKECPWGERGVGFDETYAVTAAPVYEKAGERPEPEGDASTFVPANPTEFEIRRNYMEKLLVDVKDRFDAPTAKALFGNHTPFAKMSLIQDSDIETVIAAAEAKLKEPK